MEPTRRVSAGPTRITAKTVEKGFKKTQTKDRVKEEEFDVSEMLRIFLSI